MGIVRRHRLRRDVSATRYWDGAVEFRLTYSGRLLGASRNDPRTVHKYEIRRRFHPQLKRLWECTDLKEMLDPLPSGPVVFNEGPFRKRIEALPERFACGPFRLLPLVTEDLGLFCSIEILMLRPDKPGSLIRSGDIDNRLKTLFDALRIPGPDTQELAGATPGPDENPLFCLLEDDRLISQIALQTDLLLEPIERKDSIDDNDVRLMLTVKLRPSDARYGAVTFFGS